jgi:hypothetical protein
MAFDQQRTLELKPVRNLFLVTSAWQHMPKLIDQSKREAVEARNLFWS